MEQVLKLKLPQVQLVRGIGRWEFVALIVNVTVGAGILGLPSKIFALLGVNSLWAIAACGLFILLLMLCFAEVGSRFKGTGGPYLYTLTAFGPFTGFIAGWLLWLSRVFSFASVCNLCVDYTAYLWPAASAGVIRVVFISVVIFFLAAVNYRGIRHATVVNNTITVGKLLILLLFIAAGLYFVDLGNFSAPHPVTLPAFSSSVLLLVFAFSGFDVASVPAGEVEDPQKTVPFGLFTALLIVALLYISIQYVCIGTLPGLAQSVNPIAQAAGKFMGGAGAYLITAGALITMLGTLNVLMLTSSRLLYAMAEQHQLPGRIAYVHPRYHTPTLAIVITSILLLTFTIGGSFVNALVVSAIIRLFTFITTCLALPLLRKKLKTGAPFFVRGGILIAFIATGVCLLLLLNIGWNEALNAGLLTLAGMIIYWLRKPYNKKPDGVVV